MSLLRTLGASARFARAAPRAGVGAWAAAARRAPAIAARGRSLATEVGFLDEDVVAGRVVEVVRKFEKVQPEKVTEKSHFVNDLGLDSLDAVELVMALEDEFAIEIKDEDAEKILSCEDAVKFISHSPNAQ